MEDEHDFSVTEEDGFLTIGSDVFASSEDGEAGWRVKPLNKDRILLQSKDSLPTPGTASGFSCCGIDFFADFLVGLIHRRWSGCISVNTGVGYKRIYFTDGRLAFAGSSLIDHRLGEVIYRNGFISLDQLADSTVQVTRQNKFGQVLLTSGLFSTVDLWDALKLQVLEIVRCLFLFPEIYFEMSPGKNLAPTEVVFVQESAELINESYAFGCMFREFLTRVRPETVIKIKEHDDAPDLQPSTFFGDLVELIRQDPTIAAVIESSKLLDINTYVALMTLVNRGVCEVSDAESFSPDHVQAATPVKSLIDAYSLLVHSSRQAFDKHGVVFPAEDLRSFCVRRNPSGFVSLFLNERGEIHKESVHNVYSQCENNPARVQYFVLMIESLIHFLIQVTGDLLPYEEARIVKQTFREIRA